MNESYDSPNRQQDFKKDQNINDELIYIETKGISKE